MEHKRTWSERWNQYRPTKGQAFWFAAGCMVAMLIVGFGLAGWVSGGTAKQRADEAALAARHELAAAVCVEEFLALRDANARLAKLKDAGYWDRTETLLSGGWATMPDRKEPNRIVAAMCAARLSETSS